MIVACSDAEPTERARDATDEAPPSAGPTATSEPPAPPSDTEADAGPWPGPPWPQQDYCAAVEAWCPTPDLQPQDPYVAEYLGVQQQCYCRCTEQSDCAGSPNPSECGVVHDIVIVEGVPTKQPRFTYPTVCRYTEFQQAQ